MALFDPSALPGDDPARPGSAALGPPDPDQISNTPDVSFTAGPPIIGFADGGGSAVLEAGAAAWLHALLSGVDNATGLPYDVGALLAAGGVSLTVTQADPTGADWTPALPLRRPEGVYARALIGAGGSLAPDVGRWRVYARLLIGGASYELRLPGYLVVE